MRKSEIENFLKKTQTLLPHTIIKEIKKININELEEDRNVDLYPRFSNKLRLRLAIYYSYTNFPEKSNTLLSQTPKKGWIAFFIEAKNFGKFRIEKLEACVDCFNKNKQFAWELYALIDLMEAYISHKFYREIFRWRYRIEQLIPDYDEDNYCQCLFSIHLCEAYAYVEEFAFAQDFYLKANHFLNDHLKAQGIGYRLAMLYSKCYTNKVRLKPFASVMYTKGPTDARYRDARSREFQKIINIYLIDGDITQVLNLGSGYNLLARECYKKKLKDILMVEVDLNDRAFSAKKALYAIYKEEKFELDVNYVWGDYLDDATWFEATNSFNPNKPILIILEENIPFLTPSGIKQLFKKINDTFQEPVLLLDYIRGDFYYAIAYGDYSHIKNREHKDKLLTVKDDFHKNKNKDLYTGYIDNIGDFAKQYNLDVIYQRSIKAIADEKDDFARYTFFSVLARPSEDTENFASASIGFNTP